MGLLYEKVPIGDDLISRSLSEDNEDFTRQLRELQKLQSPFSRQLFRLNIILLLISTTLLATAYILSNPNDSQYVQKFSSYSPARPAVKYVSGTFNASQAEASGYIGLSNETEEMWNWVTIDIGDQMITPEELKLIDKPESSVKTKDPRSGKEGYRIGLEVFHQLHCLNLVRKATHREYYNGKDDFVGDEGKIRTHIGEFYSEIHREALP